MLRVLLLLCLLSALQAGQRLAVLAPHSLSVYDLETGARQLSLPVEARGLAVCPDERFAFLTTGDALVGVDLATGAIAGRVEFGKYHQPAALACGKSGALYVAAQSPSALLIVDWKKKKVSKAIPLTGRNPSVVLVNSDERKIWTADTASGTVSLVDTFYKRQVGEIQVGGQPSALALSADEKQLYVATGSPSSLVWVDAVANRVRRSIGVAGGARLLAGDGRWLAGQGTDLFLIDGHLGLETRRLEGAHTDALAVEPGALYAATNGRVDAFTLPGLEKVGSLETGASSLALAILQSKLVAAQ